MKIFSSFDTKLKQKELKEAQDIYGVDKVMVLSKSGLFLFVKVVPKFIAGLIIIILTVLLSNWIFWSSQDTYTLYVFIWIVIILLTFAWPVMKHIIDYYMDFALITPKSLIMFNQTWIFKKDMATVDVEKIKTILVKKRYFLYSIFNNWDLIFLSEWDSNNFWEITLFFMHNPEEKKDKISKIIWYAI